MFDKNFYKETFSSLHASNKTFSEVMKMTQAGKRTSRAKKLRVIPLCAAIMALLLCTGFAVYYANTVLTYFTGDTMLIEPAIQQVTDKGAEQGEYAFRVDSVLSDAHNTVVGLTIEALTDEAATTLSSKEFRPTDLLRFKADHRDTGAVSVTYSAAPVRANRVNRGFSIRLEGVGAPNILRLYWAYSTGDEAAVLTLDKQIETLSVKAETPLENSDYFIRTCALNATGVELEVEFTENKRGDKIIEFYFRMADGGLKTLSQLCGTVTTLNSHKMEDSSGNVYRYTASFHTLLDPLSVKGVLMNGTEYSFLHLDNTVSSKIPATMRPFLTPFTEVNDAFYFFADDVCEHIGASLEKDGERYSIRYLGKVLTFSPEDVSINLDGEPYDLNFPATYQGNALVLPRELFTLLGLESSMYYPEASPVHAPENWLVIP